MLLCGKSFPSEIIDFLDYQIKCNFIDVTLVKLTKNASHDFKKINFTQKIREDFIKLGQKSNSTF